MHILITGHTGFKGAWLTFLLKELGHKVSGISLPPRNSSIYANSNQNKMMKREMFTDIRDYDSCYKFIKNSKPDAIIHLAAQPLVRKSYREALITYETNFNGTLNVLEISISLSIESTLIVTTDKVYEDQKRKAGYVERDSLGGFDPYSNSKALSDLLTQSYINRYPDRNLGIARAGNVIGGGDDGEERLLPDIFQSIKSDSNLFLRNPAAIRPWQYVLDCLHGYFLGLNNIKNVEMPIWNFGPSRHYTVHDFVKIFISKFGQPINITTNVDSDYMKETDYLILNSTKAQNELNWKPKMDLETTIESTLEWYQEAKKDKFSAATTKQVIKYLSLAN